MCLATGNNLIVRGDLARRCVPCRLDAETSRPCRILNLAVRYDKLDRNRLKSVELPDAQKRSRLAEPEELEAMRTVRQQDQVKRECLEELWRIVVVAVNTGLREAKVVAIERSWIKKCEDGYWLSLPPAFSRITHRSVS